MTLVKDEVALFEAIRHAETTEDPNRYISDLLVLGQLHLRRVEYVRDNAPSPSDLEKWAPNNLKKDYLDRCHAKSRVMVEVLKESSRFTAEKSVNDRFDKFEGTVVSELGNFPTKITSAVQVEFVNRNKSALRNISFSIIGGFIVGYFSGQLG